MIKYEYNLDWNIDIEKLNEYGKEGWELVSVFADRDSTQWFYFKRLMA